MLSLRIFFILAWPVLGLGACAPAASSPPPTTRDVELPQAPAASRPLVIGASDHVLRVAKRGQRPALLAAPEQAPLNQRGALLVEFPEAMPERGVYVAQLLDAREGETHEARWMSHRGYARLLRDLDGAVEQASHTHQIAFEAAQVLWAGAAGKRGAAPVFDRVVDPESALSSTRLQGSAATKSAQYPTRKVANASDLRAAMLQNTNRARSVAQKCGMHGDFAPASALTRHAKLDLAAQRYAEQMASTLHFAHTGPDGRSPGERASAEGYHGSVGENLALGSATAADAVRGLLSSPGHCKNIMWPRWRVMGIGVARDKDGTFYWVQLFGDGA